MTCRESISAVVCGPPGVFHRQFRHCPACERRHGFIVSWDGAWYGTTLYGSCGDRWMDGEMAERPWCRGWRKEARARFSAMWKNATTKDLFNQYASLDMRLAVDLDADEEALVAEQEQVYLEIQRRRLVS